MKQAGRQWLQGDRLLSGFLGLSPYRANFVLAPRARPTGITDSKSQSTSLYVTVAPGVGWWFYLCYRNFHSTEEPSWEKPSFWVVWLSVNEQLMKALHSSRNPSHVANSSWIASWPSKVRAGASAQFKDRKKRDGSGTVYGHWVYKERTPDLWYTHTNNNSKRAETAALAGLIPLSWWTKGVFFIFVKLDMIELTRLKTLCSLLLRHAPVCGCLHSVGACWGPLAACPSSHCLTLSLTVCSAVPDRGGVTFWW